MPTRRRARLLQVVAGIGLAALLLPADPALAGPKKPTNDNYPRSTRPRDVTAWLQRRGIARAGAVLALGPDTVVFRRSQRGAPAAESAWDVQTEVIRAGYRSAFGGRSALLSFNIDCSGRTLALTRMTRFQGANLTGRRTDVPTTGERLHPPPSSLLERILISACDPPRPDTSKPN